MKDKKTLITIIILLLIFTPLSALGIIKHFSSGSDKIKDENVNKEFIYNNKLYFYQDGNLLANYECLGNCGKAKTTNDDLEYHTNSYLDADLSIEPVIDSTWGIFAEDNNIYIYNLTGAKIADKYQEVKRYNSISTNNVLIAKKDNLWGAAFLDLSATGVSFSYDYLAIPAHFVENKLDTTKFIAKKDNYWHILKEDGNFIATNISDEIIDFNDSYMITYDNNYHIKDFNNIEYLENLSKDKVYALDKYIFIIANNMLMVYENDTFRLLKTLSLNNYNNMYFSKEEKSIDIYIDKNKVESIELN